MLNELYNMSHPLFLLWYNCLNSIAFCQGYSRTVKRGMDHCMMLPLYFGSRQLREQVGSGILGSINMLYAGCSESVQHVLHNVIIS